MSFPFAWQEGWEPAGSACHLRCPNRRLFVFTFDHFSPAVAPGRMRRQGFGAPLDTVPAQRLPATGSRPPSTATDGPSCPRAPAAWPSSSRALQVVDGRVAVRDTGCRCRWNSTNSAWPRPRDCPRASICRTCGCGHEIRSLRQTEATVNASFAHRAPVARLHCGSFTAPPAARAPRTASGSGRAAGPCRAAARSPET